MEYELFIVIAGSNCPNDADGSRTGAAGTRDFLLQTGVRHQQFVDHDPAVLDAGICHISFCEKTDGAEYYDPRNIYYKLGY